MIKIGLINVIHHSYVNLIQSIVLMGRIRVDPFFTSSKIFTLSPFPYFFPTGCGQIIESDPILTCERITSIP